MHETQLVHRLQKIEAELFGGTYEHNYESAREDMKKDGKIDNPKYRTKEIVKQELESHVQNYQETFSNDEKEAWHNKKNQLMQELRGQTQ